MATRLKLVCPTCGAETYRPVPDGPSELDKRDAIGEAWVAHMATPGYSGHDRPELVRIDIDQW